MNALQQTAQALIAHWDSPFWKQEIPTAAVISDLRAALAESVAVTAGSRANIEFVATHLITALQADRIDTEDWPEDSRIALAQHVAATTNQPTPDAVGCTCPVCGEWQHWTPSGMVCRNGHGGVPGINHRLFTSAITGART